MSRHPAIRRERAMTDGSIDAHLGRPMNIRSVHNPFEDDYRAAYRYAVESRHRRQVAKSWPSLHIRRAGR